MNKYHNVLLAVVVVLGTAGLSASEKPFFDKSTQDVIKRTAKTYTLGYTGLFSAGAVGATFAGIVAHSALAPFYVLFSIGTKDVKLLDNIGNPMPEIKELNRIVSKRIARTIPFTSVGILGSAIAYHKYQINCSEKREQ